MNSVDRVLNTLRARRRGTLSVDRHNIVACSEICLAGKPADGQIFIVARGAHRGRQNVAPHRDRERRLDHDGIEIVLR